MENLLLWTNVLMLVQSLITLADNFSFISIIKHCPFVCMPLYCRSGLLSKLCQAIVLIYSISPIISHHGPDLFEKMWSYIVHRLWNTKYVIVLVRNGRQSVERIDCWSWQNYINFQSNVQIDSCGRIIVVIINLKF